MHVCIRGFLPRYLIHLSSPSPQRTLRLLGVALEHIGLCRRLIFGDFLVHIQTFLGYKNQVK